MNYCGRCFRALPYDEECFCYERSLRSRGLILPDGTHTEAYRALIAQQLERTMQYDEPLWSLPMHRAAFDLGLTDFDRRFLKQLRIQS